MPLFGKSAPAKAPLSSETVNRQCRELKEAKTRRELRGGIAMLVLAHSPADIQQMKRNFETKVRNLSPDYRDRLTRKITEHLVGTFQRIRLAQQQGIFRAMHAPVTENQKRYWDMVAGQCHDDNEADEPEIRFLKYLLAGYCMLVLDEPGHPVATALNSRTGYTTARSAKRQTMSILLSARSVLHGRHLRSGTCGRRPTRASTGSRSSSTTATATTTSMAEILEIPGFFLKRCELFSRAAAYPKE
jgi:uncharacterized protein (UPF0305 family)